MDIVNQYNKRSHCIEFESTSKRTRNGVYEDDSLTELRLEKLQATVVYKRERAGQLWMQGLMNEAVGEMWTAEAIVARITRRIRLNAILAASRNGALNKPATKRRVQFAQQVEILGYADADVDRIPAQTTPVSVIERMIIRAARILPNSCGI